MRLIVFCRAGNVLVIYSCLDLMSSALNYLNREFKNSPLAAEMMRINEEDYRTNVEMLIFDRSNPVFCINYCRFS